MTLAEMQADPITFRQPLRIATDLASTSHSSAFLDSRENSHPMKSSTATSPGQAPSFRACSSSRRGLRNTLRTRSFCS